MSGVHANFEAIEASGSNTYTLVRKSRKLIITNDSSSVDLKYKFNETEAFGTLFPTESISLYFTTRTVIVSGNGNYRIWSYG
jgi:hypothetical protein